MQTEQEKRAFRPRTVRIRRGYGVRFDGKHYGGGDMLTLPQADAQGLVQTQRAEWCDEEYRDLTAKKTAFAEEQAKAAAEMAAQSPPEPPVRVRVRLKSNGVKGAAVRGEDGQALELGKEYEVSERWAREDMGNRGVILEDPAVAQLRRDLVKAGVRL